MGKKPVALRWQDVFKKHPSKDILRAYPLDLKPRIRRLVTAHLAECKKCEAWKVRSNASRSSKRRP